MLGLHVRRELLERPLTAGADAATDALLDLREDANRSPATTLGVLDPLIESVRASLSLFAPMRLAGDLIAGNLKFGALRKMLRMTGRAVERVVLLAALARERWRQPEDDPALRALHIRERNKGCRGHFYLPLRNFIGIRFHHWPACFLR